MTNIYIRSKGAIVEYTGFIPDWISEFTKYCMINNLIVNDLYKVTNINRSIYHNFYSFESSKFIYPCISFIELNMYTRYRLR